MNGIAIVLTVLITGDRWQVTTLERGQVPPVTEEQLHWYSVITWGGLAVVSLLGLVVLLRVLHSPRLRASGDRAALDVGEQVPDRHAERP